MRKISAESIMGKHHPQDELTRIPFNPNLVNDVKDIGRICESHAKIRNKYTHEGRRISMPPLNSKKPYVLLVGSIVKDSNGSPVCDEPVTIKADEYCDSPFIENRIDKLIFHPGFDLINLIANDWLETQANM